jgi:glycosyltransferase XagB
MARGLELARRSNVRFGKAMLALGYINQDQLTRALAEQFEMPRVDLSPESFNPDVARLIPADLAQDRGVLPLAISEQSALVATTDPLDSKTIDELTRRLGRTIRTVLTTEQQMESALGALYRTENVERASLGLLTRAPEDSAARVWTRGQVIGIALIGALFLVGMLLSPVLTLTVLVTGVTGFYAAFSFYKLYLIYRALGGTFEEEVSPEELAALDDRDLPVYTVLVPMYREAGVLPILLQALGRMDYPSTKLDVILLLEEDDEETQAAVRSTRLPEGFRALVVPFRRPKTKPKACNYGLLHARGEFLVIYDAEDVPEPDQLKKAVAVFRRYDERLACIQSKLNYFNRDQNLLTRWFTAEYSQWFDLMLPGLQNSGAPIPLGGTSNHFRTEILREMDGWDPFNTTEDADLGLRIFKRGYRTVVLNSTTYEEANSRLRNWVRQRSRWVKGYMQTWLVHMRNPVRLIRQIGVLPFISFQLVIAGTFFSFLLNPVLWGLTVLWFLTHWQLINDIFPAPVFYVGAVSLYAGNLAFLYVNVLGTLRRRYYPLVTYALFTPIYWAMMSIAAWQAFYELLFKPHYWQKTQHGLFKGKIRMPAAGKRAA